MGGALLAHWEISMLLLILLFRDRQNHKVLRIETLLLPSNCGSLLPSDWPMLPLLHHYNAAVEG